MNRIDSMRKSICQSILITLQLINSALDYLNKKSLTQFRRLPDGTKKIGNIMLTIQWNNII
jgi:hypothetical protein